jgi:hypothetical protein
MNFVARLWIVRDDDRSNWIQSRSILANDLVMELDRACLKLGEGRVPNEELSFESDQLRDAWFPFEIEAL